MATLQQVDACVRVPEVASIDFYGLENVLGKKIFTGDEFDRGLFSKSIEIVLDAIMRKYGCESKFKKTQFKKDGGVKWEFKSFPCFFAIYLQNASLSYVVRLNTVNSDRYETMRCLYFDYDHMACYPDSLLEWVLRDFSELVWEAVNLDYTFEGRGDSIPSGTYRTRIGEENKVPFFYLHESILMTPRHYYDGTGYPHKDDGECRPCDFDGWMSDAMLKNLEGRK